MADEVMAPEEQIDVEQMMMFEQMRQAYPNEITFEEDKQKTLVEIVLHDFKVSDDARKLKDGSSHLSWEDKIKILLESWEGIRKPKVKPFRGCSNKTMRLTTAIEQTMQSTYLTGVWKNGEVDFKPGERTDAQRIERVNKFMQFIVQKSANMGTGLYNALDDFVHSVTKLGTGFFKYSWSMVEAYLPQKVPDPQTGEITTQFMPVIQQGAQVIVVPVDALYFQPGSTSVQGPQPLIHRVTMSYSELIDGMNKGDFLDKNEALSNSAYKNFEGELGPIDSVNQDATKLAKYEAKMRNYPMDILEWYGKVDIGDPRGPQDCIIWVEKNSRQFLSGKLLRTVNQRNKRPFISAPCLKRGGDILGIGYVELSKPLADEVDAQFNQANDANTLDIMPSGFYSPTSGFDADKVELGPNVWLPVENPVQNVYMPTRNRNTEKFMMIIRTVMMFMERLTAASSYQMGKEDEMVGGTGSATRTNQIIAHAEMRMGPVLRRVAAAWCELQTEVYYLYYQNAPPGFAERIIGEDGSQLFPSMILQESFLGEVDAYCIPDLTLASKDSQRQLAQWVFDTFSVHPLVMTSYERMWEVAYQVLTKMGHPNPESVIGPRPGVNPNMEMINVENTRMLQGEMVAITPMDVDIQHITGHMQMLQSRDLPEQIKQIIGMHIQQHQQRLSQNMGNALGAPEGGNNGEGTGTPPNGQGNATT